MGVYTSKLELAVPEARRLEDQQDHAWPMASIMRNRGQQGVVAPAQAA